MRSADSETSLATQLCGDLLSVTELKQLCLSRGFPAAGLSRGELAAGAAARFLDPIGVAGAMAGLEPLWLKALHLVAASEEPLPLRSLSHLISPAEKEWDIDWRGFWRRVTSGLLSKGVALAVDGEAPRYEKSRYARYHLVIPTTFLKLLPPFPVQTGAFLPGEPSGSMEDLLSDALLRFTRRTAPEPKDQPQTLADRISRCLEIEDGILRLAQSGRPTAMYLKKLVTGLWESSLPLDTKGGARLAPGPLARHILERLPAASGCTPDALSRALAELGISLQTNEVEVFLEEGTTAGLLDRSQSEGMESLYCITPERKSRETRLRLVPERDGVLVDPLASDLLAVLQVAAISRASLEKENGTLHFVPDLIRMGRTLPETPVEVSLRLLDASPAFAAAIRQIEKRDGKVIVHQGLAVLRVRDVGLHALFCQRFPGSVRDLGSGFLACLASEVEPIVAFAQKEGFVARRES